MSEESLINKCEGFEISRFLSTNYPESTKSEIVNATIRECVDVLDKKGKDYNDPDETFSEIKAIVRSLGVSPKVILMVYLYKHLSAIFKWCRDENLESEPISSRLTDAINYLILMNVYRVLYEEEKGSGGC